MNRDEKKQWVEGFRNACEGSEIIVLTHYKGLTVSEMTELRGNIREAGASFKVTNNLLAQIAVKGTAFEHLASQFEGPTAVAYATDPVAAAKVVCEFAKNHDKLVPLGASFAGTYLDASEVESLAKLPSLDELRAKIISLINTPARNVAGVLGAPAGQLARVFNAYAEDQSAA